MFARLATKILLLVAAAALVFFGIGLLGLAGATFLIAQVGAATAYAVAGGIMVLAGLVIVLVMRTRRPPPPPPGGFATLLLGALAKDLPWATVLSAGLAGVTEMVLKRRRTRSGS